MKRILYSLCIGSVLLALTASGAAAAKPDPKKKGHGKTSAQVTASAKGKTTVRGGGKARVQRSVARPRASSKVTAKRAGVRTDRGRAISKPSVVTRSKHHTSRDVATRSKGRASREVATKSTGRTSREAARPRAGQTAAARTTAAARSNLAVNRERNLTFARNVAVNRDPNVRIVNNWRNDRFRGGNYTAFYNYNRVWHDRVWWVNNYPRIIFVLGGWWYWNVGYWYPAWGYDPYSWYAYDGPIYTGYADLAPDQVITNVQLALQQQGYYAGPVDGILGPQTRGGLAAFQADNGLAVTSSVDQPTLATLGLT